MAARRSPFTSISNSIEADMTMTPANVTMLTFAPMINSETCRFVLTHYGIPFEEQRHIFGAVSVIAYIRNGDVHIPLIQGDGGFSVIGPLPVIDHYDPQAAADRRLVPADPAAKAQVMKDFQYYNGDLAGETAVIGYDYLLPHKDIMIGPFTEGLPMVEADLTSISYPLLEVLFDSLLHLSPERVAQALTKVRAIFAETDKRIADGRQYLVGDQLTIGDIALATGAGPLILPPYYGSPMPAFDVMPPELKTLITELRATPTGKFVVQLYEKHRRGG
jgi:glutathione S-transferase